MSVSHTRCFRFSPQYSPSHGTNARSPLAVPQGEVPEERGLRQLRYSVARKRGSARRNPSSCPHLDIRSLSFYADLGNPKTTLRIATDISEPRICPFLILAVFGFPLNTPLPTGRTLTRRSRSRKGKFPKSAVIRRGHHHISPKRGWARWSRKFVRVKLVYSFLLTTDSWQLDNRHFGTPPLLLLARFFI